MGEFKIQPFSKTRIATNDVCAIGIQKHHIAALIEVDVSLSLNMINNLKFKGDKISFTSWLIKVISTSIQEFDQVAAFLYGKQKLIIFNDVNVSLIVEKEKNGQKVPIPLIIEKANDLSVESIAEQIKNARSQTITKSEIVLHQKTNSIEQLYYILPGFLRCAFWRYLLKHPHFAFRKMGNVGITSIGMVGSASGWFIPISVHPICFGIGRIIKKPVVVDDKIEIREMLPMTILMDHDVIDGANMVRFISRLSDNISRGIGLVE